MVKWICVGVRKFGGFGAVGCPLSEKIDRNRREVRRSAWGFDLGFGATQKLFSAHARVGRSPSRKKRKTLLFDGLVLPGRIHGGTAEDESREALL